MQTREKFADELKAAGWDVATDRISYDQILASQAIGSYKSWTIRATVVVFPNSYKLGWQAESSTKYLSGSTDQKATAELTADVKEWLKAIAIQYVKNCWAFMEKKP